MRSASLVRLVVEAGADVGREWRRCRGRRSGPGSRGWSGRRGSAARLLSASPPCFFEVPGDQGLDGGAVVGVEVAAGDEVVGQGAGLVERPGLEGGHELALVDQAVLQGQQAEEQVAVGGDGGHGAGLLEGGRRRGRSVPDVGGLRPGRARIAWIIA